MIPDELTAIAAGDRLVVQGDVANLRKILTIEGLRFTGALAPDAIEAMRKDVFAETVSGKPLNQTFDSIDQGSFEKFARTNQIAGANSYLSGAVDVQQRIDSLRAAEAEAPSLRQRTDPERIARTREVATRNFVKHGGGDRAFRVGEFSLDYPNLFPSNAADVNHGLHGELLNDWQNPSTLDKVSQNHRPYGGGSLGGGSAKVQPIKASVPAASRATASVQRARSFGRLRGFSRIGGVLIGRVKKTEENGVRVQILTECITLPPETASVQPVAELPVSFCP